MVRSRGFAGPLTYSALASSPEAGVSARIAAPSSDGGAGCLVQETGPEARGCPPARVGQDLAGALVHAAGRARLAIVIAGQVEQTVDHEEVELEGDSHADQPGLSLRGIRRDHDFAEEPRGPGGVEVERQHVRAPARAHPPSVETTDGRIVHHGDVDVPACAAQ